MTRSARVPRDSAGERTTRCTKDSCTVKLNGSTGVVAPLGGGLMAARLRADRATQPLSYSPDVALGLLRASRSPRGSFQAPLRADPARHQRWSRQRAQHPALIASGHSGRHRTCGWIQAHPQTSTCWAAHVRPPRGSSDQTSRQSSGHWITCGASTRARRTCDDQVSTWRGPPADVGVGPSIDVSGGPEQPDLELMLNRASDLTSGGRFPSYPGKASPRMAQD